MNVTILHKLIATDRTETLRASGCCFIQKLDFVEKLVPQRTGQSFRTHNAASLQSTRRSGRSESRWEVGASNDNLLRTRCSNCQQYSFVVICLMRSFGRNNDFGGSKPAESPDVTCPARSSAASPTDPPVALVGCSLTRSECSRATRKPCSSNHMVVLRSFSRLLFSSSFLLPTLSAGETDLSPEIRYLAVSAILSSRCAVISTCCCSSKSPSSFVVRRQHRRAVYEFYLNRNSRFVLVPCTRVNVAQLRVSS